MPSARTLTLAVTVLVSGLLLSASGAYALPAVSVPSPSPPSVNNVVNNTLNLISPTATPQAPALGNTVNGISNGIPGSGSGGLAGTGGVAGSGGSAGSGGLAASGSGTGGLAASHGSTGGPGAAGSTAASAGTAGSRPRRTHIDPPRFDLAAEVILTGRGSPDLPGFLPPPLASLIRYVVAVGPGLVDSFLAGHGATNQLDATDLLLAFGVVLLAVLALARLLLDVRNRARLRRALAPTYAASVAYGRRARRRVHVAYNDVTGVLRRMATMEAVQAAIERVRRSRDHRLVLALVDVRHTDGDGAAEGGHHDGVDETEKIGHGLAVGLRRQDTVFRYGGDELLCVMPHINVREAETMLAHLRTRMRAGGLDFRVSVAPLQEGDDARRLLERAEIGSASGEGEPQMQPQLA